MNSIQYTIRGVSPVLDKELRRLAKRGGQSLNTVTLETLKIGIGLQPWSEPNYDLDDLFGKLDKKEAQSLNHASAESRAVDKNDWQ